MSKETDARSANPPISYQLQIHVHRDITLRVGRLGCCSFPSGYYVYTGSARKNLAARLSRHQGTEKRMRWHIDYLLSANDVELKGTTASSLAECEWNQAMPGRIVVPRFGATDCRHRCGSHLKYLGTANRQLDEGTDSGTRRLRPADLDQAEPIASMALDIWQRHYLPDILTRAELDHLWQRGYSPEVLRDQMRSGSRFFWIEQDGRNVGFVAYKPEAERARLWLTKLYVLPEYHGSGLGAYALDSVRQAALEHGLDEIWLYVFRKNERAIRAYQRAGFEILCEDRSDAGGGFCYDDYIMVAGLKAQRARGAPDTRLFRTTFEP